MRPSQEFEEYVWAVLKAAADVFDVPPLTCLNILRKKPQADVRRVCWTIIREQTGTSLPLIAALFGMHHTAVFYALQRHPDTELVRKVIDRMNGTPIPPTWVKTATRHVTTKEYKHSVSPIKQCPVCASTMVYPDLEQKKDRTLWFCARCDSDWKVTL